MNGTKKIAVIGGGPAGLACARALQLKGIEVVVYDADASVSSRDAGGTLDLHADTGQIALERSGLMQAFRALARFEGQSKSRRDHHGTILASFQPTADDDAALEIDRGQLRTMLFEHLRPDTVRWNHKLLAAVPLGGGRHRLEFASGEATDVDLVIGAYGTWTRVRTLVTSTTPFYTGVSYIDSRFDDVDIRHPDVARIVGDGHMFSADGQGRASIVQRNSAGTARGYIMFRAAIDWYRRVGVDITNKDAMRAYLRTEFSGWDESMMPLITDIDSEYVNRPIWALPTPISWEHVPGVTLIGDAAHVMAPFGGYGVNLALLDGTELANIIASTPSIDDAIIRYESRMMARSGPLATEANTALQRFFDAPFTTGTAPDHEQAHQRYKNAAAEHRLNRLCVAIDAFADRFALDTTLPDEGTAHEDVTRQIRTVSEFYASSLGSTFAVLLASASQDPDARACLEERLTSSRQHGIDVLWHRAVQRHETRHDITADLALDILFGPVMRRLLSGRKRLTDAEVEALVASVLA